MGTHSRGRGNGQQISRQKWAATNNSEATPPEPPEPPEPGPGLGGAVVVRDALFLGSRHGGTASAGGITLRVDGRGVAVSMPPDPAEHLLPWASLLAHVVEPWSGGIIPEWWVDPELHHVGGERGLDPVAIDPSAGAREPVHVEPGALISFRTPATTYRFLVPGGDAGVLAARIAELAVTRLGPVALPAATTVRISGPPSRYGKGMAARRDGERPTWYRRLRVGVTVVVILLVATAATLVLLQSAGRIRLPILGGAGPGEISLATPPASPPTTPLLQQPRRSSAPPGSAPLQDEPVQASVLATPANRSTSIPSGHATPGAVRPSW